MVTDPLIIGIDLGTTNGKVVCYDLNGIVHAESVQSYPTHHPRSDWYEQDPGDWTEALGRSLKEVTSTLGPQASKDVAGMAVSNFGPGLVFVDQGGAPLAPCPTWQDDRSREQGQTLIEEVGRDWVGLGSPETGFPAKALWAIEEKPDLVSKTYQLLDIKSFLMKWLTGSAATDPSSGPGAWNWNTEVFEFANWPVEKLPRIIDPTDKVGGLQKELANRVGLVPGLPIFAGVNDGAAATLGSGSVRLGDSVITLATNGVFRLVVEERLDPNLILEKSLFSWPFVEGRWICGGFTRCGAGSLQWLAGLFGIPNDPSAYDELLKEAADVPPGSQGVIFLPYLAGRGTPKNDPELKGGFAHVGLEHGRPQLTRAVLEGTTYALAEIYEAFSHLGFNVKSIRVTGGGARSQLWRRIIANVLDRSLTYAGGDATLGNAMIVSVGLGLYPDFNTASKAMVKTHGCEEPLSKEVDKYEQLSRFFNRTRDAMLDTPRPYEFKQKVRPE